MASRNHWYELADGRQWRALAGRTTPGARIGQLADGIHNALPHSYREEDGMGRARFCGFCGAGRAGTLLQALKPADETQAWRFCNYCWLFLEIGFRTLWPDDDATCLQAGGRSRLTAREVDACLTEGVLQRARAAHWQER